MSALGWSRASYLVASVDTVADELERALTDDDPAPRRTLRAQSAEPLDVRSRRLREEDEIR